MTRILAIEGTDIRREIDGCSPYYRASRSCPFVYQNNLRFSCALLPIDDDNHCPENGTIGACPLSKKVGE